MWKRYKYTGEGELLVLETSEGAKILEPGDTFLMSDEYDLTGRPFTAVGGVIKENGDKPADPPADPPKVEDPPPAEPAATDPPAASPEATPVAQEGSN